MAQSTTASFYVTTPIYYVTAKPHLGSLYSTLLADVAARWHKLLGEDVCFVTGTDEHGQKIAQAAAAANMTPQAFVDSFIPAYKECWEKYRIDYTHFIRTTDKAHAQAVSLWITDLLKTGDIIFAVLDTSVNSDQPGPILATIVSGQFKGARLIGSFNLPSNSDSLVISFNTMSVPGAAKSTSISAYAIDANTAQTALSSRADHHYLLRYGSLFASSFLEGFGNAFQSANTTVTIGGTAGGDNVTVQNGIGRSALQNAVIGMATLGKSWGQAAQQQFSTPTTVEVFAGTPMGILFTQDLTTL